MDREILFSEKQSFRQWYVWLLLGILNAKFSLPFFKHMAEWIAEGIPFIPDKGITFSVVVILAVTVLLVVARLDTEIRNDGIYYRFLPFQWSMKRISWKQISESYIRRYNPLLEYGGWGLRIGLFGHGWAFSASGNKGLQLIYKNGTKFLLGTQKPEEIERVLQQLQHERKT